MDIQDNFAKFQEKVDREDEIYENFRIGAEDYNFPHIYLTDEEIIEFNEECKRAGIDLKVVPLSEYMNISGGKYEEHNIESDIEILNNSFIEKKEDDEEEKTNEEKKSRSGSLNYDKIGYDKKYIGKKHKRKVIETDEEDNKKDEKNSNFDEKSLKSFKSSIDFNKNKYEDSKLNKDRNNNKNKNKNKKQQKDKKKNPPKKSIEKEKNEKKNKKNPKNHNINDNFNNFFKRIKETSSTYKDRDKKIEKLIKDILEKSQYLTKDGLKEIADFMHIRLIGDELSINQLKKLSHNQLENLLINIEINTDINKLDPNRKDNIKKMRNKEELERKSRERIQQKKIMKDEKKKKESLNKKNNNNYNDNSNKGKMDDDESESGTSYDEDDGLN